VLIGDLLNCEVAWYFQADKPADKFDAKTRLSMTYSNMHKFPSKLETLAKRRCIYLEKNIPLAYALVNDERFWNATNALWVYRWNPNPAIQLSVVWGGIEALFLIEYNIKSKLSTAASRFLTGTDNMVDDIKLLYQARCKAVHERKRGEKDSLQASAKLLHRLVLKCVQLQSVPNVTELLR
jgi:hypothetical protein